jgi:hypothetical protein
MFKIFINDGTNTAPKDNIYYIVGKEGVFLKKKMGLIESTIKVNQVSILNTVEEKAKLTVRKIKSRSFSRIIHFYKDIYEKFHSEAVVLLYYNPSMRRYKIYAPKQNVTGASGVYKVEKTFPNYQLMGTIHSHGMMSAFHSSTDDADEKNFDGLHITVGYISHEELDIACSIIANEKRFKVNPIDYIDGLTESNTMNTTRYKLNGTLYPYNKKWLKRINKHRIEHNTKKPEITIQNNYNLFDTMNPLINADDYTQELLKRYYKTHSINDYEDYHPCAGCALFDSAKERFEKDFIEEHDLEDLLDDKDFGEIDLDSLDEISLEYKIKKK